MGPKPIQDIQSITQIVCVSHVNTDVIPVVTVQEAETKTEHVTSPHTPTQRQLCISRPTNVLLKKLDHKETQNPPVTRQQQNVGEMSLLMGEVRRWFRMLNQTQIWDSLPRPVFDG